MRKKLKNIIIFIIITIVLGIIIWFIYANFTTAPYIKNIEISDSINFKDQVIFNVQVDNYFYKLNN